MKKILFALGLLFLCSNAWARTCTWDGGGGDNLASTAANWDTDTTCIAADAVVFDGTSAKNCTFDLTAAFASFNFTGYTGTFTLGADIISSGSFTLVSGMTFTPSTYKVTFNATGTVTSAGKSFYKVRIGASGATITLADDMTVNNTLTFDEAWASGTTINGYTIKAKGDIERSAASLNHNVFGTTTLSIEGSGTQNVLLHCYIAGLAYNVTFKLPIVINSTGTVVFTSGGTSTLGGDFTYTAGTVTTTGSNIIINNQGTARNWSSGSIAWNNVRFEGNTGTTTLGSDLNVSGTLDFGNNWVTMTLNGYSINASGNVQRNSDIGTLYGNITGTTVLTLTGTASQSFAVPGYNTTIGLKLSTTINKSGGTLTFTGTNNYGTGTFTYTAGTVDSGTSVLYIVEAATLNTNGMSWYDITMGANITLGSNLTLTRNWTKTAGTLSGAYAVVFNGTSTASGSTAFYSLTVNSGKTLNLTTGQTFSTNASGTFYAVSATIASTTGTDAIFNMNGSQSVALTTATDIDSSGGSTVHNYLGTNTGTINWDTAAAATPVTTAYTWVG